MICIIVINWWCRMHSNSVYFNINCNVSGVEDLNISATTFTEIESSLQEEVAEEKNDDDDDDDDDDDSDEEDDGGNFNL